MRNQWNTGRWYTEAGQRIIAETVEGGIIFHDIDRCIDGFIVLPKQVESPSELKELVMFMYDHSQYTWHEAARKLEWV